MCRGEPDGAFLTSRQWDRRRPVPGLTAIIPSLGAGLCDCTSPSSPSGTAPFSLTGSWPFPHVVSARSTGLIQRRRSPWFVGVCLRHHVGMHDYLDVNRANWDERAPAHAASPDYAVERFVSDPSFISSVVSFDRPRLGDLTGVKGVHLQCHIGTDTISLARLGAQMTGLDFSPASLAEARNLARTHGDVGRVCRGGRLQCP